MTFQPSPYRRVDGAAGAVRAAMKKPRDKAGRWLHRRSTSTYQCLMSLAGSNVATGASTANSWAQSTLSKS